MMFVQYVIGVSVADLENWNGGFEKHKAGGLWGHENEYTLQLLWGTAPQELEGVFIFTGLSWQF